MEIIDLRYQNFKFALPRRDRRQFVVVGLRRRSTGRARIRTSPISVWSMEVDGRPVEIGSTAAILGDPVALAGRRRAARRRRRSAGSKAGWIILAGGATAAHSLKVGERVRLTMQNLGSVSIRVDGVATMPIVEITMIEGRTPEAKRRLIAQGHRRDRGVDRRAASTRSASFCVRFPRCISAPRARPRKRPKRRPG